MERVVVSCCSLVGSHALHAVGSCLGQTGDDHRVLEIFKRLLFFLLQRLKPANQLLLTLFELLGLTLILVNQLLLVVDPLPTFCSGVS